MGFLWEMVGSLPTVPWDRQESMWDLVGNRICGMWDHDRSAVGFVGSAVGCGKVWEFIQWTRGNLKHKSPYIGLECHTSHLMHSWSGSLRTQKCHGCIL